MRRSLFLMIILLACRFSFSQDPSSFVVSARIIDGDTIPVMTLPEVEIRYYLSLSHKEARKMTKLIRNVKKVYPYAKLAGIKLEEYEDILLAAQDDKERKRIMKQAEDELKEQYGDDLKDMTFSQGKILIKLVERETGSTSYELVEELRGRFTAFFYQTFAKLFGYDLKVHYDPEGEDKEIENIVRLIESGQL